VGFFKSAGKINTNVNASDTGEAWLLESDRSCISHRLMKKDCYSHSQHRQDNSLWQWFDRCIAGTNQQDTTMIDATVLWKYNGIQFVRNRITKSNWVLKKYNKVFNAVKLTKYLCIPATFIPHERLFSKTWINLKEEKIAFRHAVLNFKDFWDIWIEAHCLHHLWRWKWQFRNVST